MYEIKSVDGKALYVAKNAVDVRAAVEEAVETGANLAGAHLARANLAGANLNRANLNRANLNEANLNRAYLNRANLDGAYLNRAYLARANLNAANLNGAYLDGTNLDGAYLNRANLDGANLNRAYLARAAWRAVAEALHLSLNAMNDGGRHWIKGVLRKTLGDGSQAYCSIGSVNQHSEGTTGTLAKWLLSMVCAGSIEEFNDAETTTWEDVQAVFSVAIRHAERLAGKA